MAGDTVTWVNRTGVEHTVVRCTPAACNGVSGGSAATDSFAPGTVGAAQGATFSHTFAEPGTYVYYCTIHGYALMHGTITVSPAATATTAAPTDRAGVDCRSGHPDHPDHPDRATARAHGQQHIRRDRAGPDPHRRRSLHFELHAAAPAPVATHATVSPPRERITARRRGRDRTHNVQ